MKIKKKKPQLLLQFFILCRHRLIFPGRFQPSIVSTDELNYRVRDGNGWTLIAKNTDYACAYYALVLISEAIIYDCHGFVNTFLKYFSIFFKFFCWYGETVRILCSLYGERGVSPNYLVPVYCSLHRM